MNKATKGVIAGALGIGLLSGGATFALWSDQATMAGGTITNGTLNIDAVADSRTWSDISGIAIQPIEDISEFKMVPGDKIQLSQDLKVELEGTNLKAALTVAITDSYLPEGVSATFTVHDNEGNRIGPANLPLDPTSAGPIDLPEGTLGTFEGTVSIQVAFDRGADEQTSINAESILGNVTFTLTQR